MASNDSLLSYANMRSDVAVVNASTAALDERNGHPVRVFDQSPALDQIQFQGVLPRLLSAAPTGITVVLIWCAGPVAGNVLWEAKVERMEGAGTDIDADSFAAAQSNTAAVPGTSGVLKYTSIAFTNGAQMDSAAREEMIRIHIRRNAANVADTCAGPAYLVGVAVKET